MQLTTSSLGASPCVTHVIELCGTNCFIASDEFADEEDDIILRLETAADAADDAVNTDTSRGMGKAKPKVHKLSSMAVPQAV